MLSANYIGYLVAYRCRVFLSIKERGVCGDLQRVKQVESTVVTMTSGGDRVEWGNHYDQITGTAGRTPDTKYCNTRRWAMDNHKMWSMSVKSTNFIESHDVPFERRARPLPNKLLLRRLVVSSTLQKRRINYLTCRVESTLYQELYQFSFEVLFCTVN